MAGYCNKQVLHLTLQCIPIYVSPCVASNNFVSQPSKLQECTVKINKAKALTVLEPKYQNNMSKYCSLYNF